MPRLDNGPYLSYLTIMNTSLDANLIWNMTRKCNFACHYCYYPPDHTPVDHVLDPDILADLLEETNFLWTVTLTGGEPFLYPGFIAICRRLTENNRIEIDSNLSLSSGVKAFADGVNPSRVNLIYASLHIEERERRGGEAAFVKNARLLMDKGFPVKVNYVVHPRVVHRFDGDRKRFRALGIPLIPRPFKGRHGNRRYPGAYDNKARQIFNGNAKAGAKTEYNFHGVPCEGGRRFVRMEPDGTFFRCSGDKRVLGKLGSGVCFNGRPEPCAVVNCPCRGLDHVHLDSGQQAFAKGIMYANVWENEKSQKAFEKTLDHNPVHAGALNNLGVLAMRGGEYEQARAYFNRARTLSPENRLIGSNATRSEGEVSGRGLPGEFELCHQIVFPTPCV